MSSYDLVLLLFAFGKIVSVFVNTVLAINFVMRY